MTSYGKKNVIHEGKRTISDWLSIFRKKESLTLNGRKLRLGDKIYFISLEDGACGEVNYYPPNNPKIQ